MVITLDKRKKPLGFCSEKRARTLLGKRSACVYKYFPFTIIIKDADVRTMEPVASYRVKIDPGAKHTGLAIVRNSDKRLRCLRKTTNSLIDLQGPGNFPGPFLLE